MSDLTVLSVISDLSVLSWWPRWAWWQWRPWQVGGHLTKCACVAASIALNDESWVTYKDPINFHNDPVLWVQMLDSQKGPKMKHFAKFSHHAWLRSDWTTRCRKNQSWWDFHIYMKRWSGPSLDASVFYVVTNALKCVVALEVVC